MRTEQHEQLHPKEQLIMEIVRREPQVVGLQTYEYFRSDAEKQKNAFIAQDEGNLQLGYPDLSRERVHDIAIASEEATKSILPGEKDEKIIHLFDAIEYRQAELFLVLLAADMNNPELSEEERAEAKEWYRQVNEAVYGLPEPEV